MATFEALGHMSLPSSCTEKQLSSSSLDMFNGREEATAARNVEMKQWMKQRPLVSITALICVDNLI